MAQEDVDLAPFEPEELEALPIFPLPRVVLLPGGVLPLHVFEPRYRAMVSDCLSHGPRAIAMAMLAPGWERDYEGRPPTRTIAGAGRIVAHRRNPDGTYDLVLHGVTRVRLDERSDLDRPYRVASATAIDDEDDRDEDALRRALEPVLAIASSLSALEKRGLVPPPQLVGTPSSVADRIADRWIHEANARQEILETTSVPRRIALVGDALVTLLARLATPSGSGAAN
ncbi:LON peptidase substrate-binding domain-containing protein [Sandaracinus amylolyticus]|uniref:Lon N-terminal domain-containing protein n=1 Tax=Sandaracinus amylolyticus TaxID=927083 RepID=A0A0F6W9A4_9BACT|nr:LON peptidase substrate-binding domain-containing protein [Sandaracinus amylolyticus]AKF10673.1 Hypothetical protein DB32_007822 [Sandaracinus amylolyticus]